MSPGTGPVNRSELADLIPDFGCGVLTEGGLILYQVTDVVDVAVYHWKSSGNLKIRDIMVKIKCELILSL